MKKLTLCICLISLFLFGGCTLIEEESDQIDEGESLEIKGQNLSFSIFQIVTIDLGNNNFSNGQIQGTTLEGEKIPMVIQDNKLTFLLPKLNQGEYKLVFMEKNQSFNITFMVKPHDLKESPETILANYRRESAEQIAALESTKDLLQGVARETLEKDILTLKSYTEGKMAEVALLTPSEQVDMALFLQSNEAWLKEVSDAVNTFSSFLPNARLQNGNVVNIEERSERVMKEFVEAKLKVIANLREVLVIFAIGTLSGGPGVGLAFAGIAVVIYSRSFIKLMASIDSVVALLNLVHSDDLNANLRASYLFKNDEQTELFAIRTYRTIFNEDSNSSISFVKDFVLGFRELIQGWNNLITDLPIDLSYQPVDFTQRNEFQTQSLRVHSDHLNFSAISNPKVTGSAKKDDGKLLLTFKTTETDAQEFDFKITYENQYFGKQEKTLDAAVINSGCSVELELTEKNVLTATATGYGPFKFAWSSGEKIETDKTHQIKIARSGDYTVKVTDQMGCESQATVNVPCTLQIEVLNDGNTFTIEVLDGFPPYYYTWSTNTFANTENLPPGSHSVKVSDGLGCEILHTINISCDLEVSVKKDGNTVTAQPTGGTAPFTYSWSNGATTASQSNLAAGFYTVVVKDKVGCEKSGSITIFCNLAVNIQKEGNNVTAQPTGGTPPYTFTWSNGVTTASQSNLTPGSYTVVVKDKAGCEKPASVTIISEGPEYGTFTDPRDGNVYKTVKIGNQTWFAENLRYAVNWNNGNQTGQPALSYNNTIYGKLYNWYAVNTATLCPQGWHIPTDAEWTILTNFLGGVEAAGGKMKSVTGWTAPNTAATNESGFTGLPGGYRIVNGEIVLLGSWGYWWSSTPYGYGTNSAVLWSLGRSSGGISTGYYLRTGALSCRCLKD